MLFIIIPTLNAENTLAATLDSVLVDIVELNVEMAVTVVVVDGGSTDATRTIATDKGVQVIETPPGRGRQLAAGAATAREAWLLFLHADTRLSTGWLTAVHHFIAADDNLKCAGYFRLSFDERSPGSVRVARLANWRAHALGLPYGDQGLLIHTSLFNAIGGYREDLDLMEDVDIIRRIGTTRVKRLPADAITSAQRYRTQGWWLRPVKNLLCLTLYFLGAPNAWIKKLYA